MKRHNLLIVDDEKEILRSLRLTFTEDHDVFTASSGTEALEILQQQGIALIITDQRMPEMTGVELLKRVIDLNPQIMRILLTGYTDTAALVQAINQGHIYQYITKPWERQDLRLVIRRALETYEMNLENQRLAKELQMANEQLRGENAFLKTEIHKNWQCTEIVGCSPAMQHVLDLVHRVIGNSATVLLTGETGTGKTLLACYIHNQGPRKDRLFIEQNCGALPETLLESELFGYKRGAFTGAVQDRKGLFEVADGGTIFLDEISEMSPMLQVKLLQVLQDGRFRRVGDSEYRKADVRIIAATHKDLPTEIQKGRFRQDLYYRVNIFPIHLPPLRERIEDIPLLAEHCLKRQQHKLKIPPNGFSEEALEELCHYSYPGNVRELENLIERALILNTGDQIQPGAWKLVDFIDIDYPIRVKKMEHAKIQRLKELYKGNLDLVARAMGISRTTLWRRMKDFPLVD
ncbi:MAG: two-component system, NtrC family, response regulator HupR/HoxA [Pseudomonadota bacterium]|nr:two-component system, NtrC family, response regulator HupR/HoxA [Pseudomonadota bacterium]